jgi:hypothetical protein
MPLSHLDILSALLHQEVALPDQTASISVLTTLSVAEEPQQAFIMEITCFVTL